MNKTLLNPVEILHGHRLKKTAARMGIIGALQESEIPLSENDMKEKMRELYDRVTFYRNVQTLSEAGIIHRIVADNVTIRYALNINDKDNKKESEHAHFFCQQCNAVICLDDVKTGCHKLPDGFIADHCEVIIKGLCNKCAH